MLLTTEPHSVKLRQDMYFYDVSLLIHIADCRIGEITITVKHESSITSFMS